MSLKNSDKFHSDFFFVEEIACFIKEFVLHSIINCHMFNNTYFDGQLRLNLKKKKLMPMLLNVKTISFFFFCIEINFVTI